MEKTEDRGNYRRIQKRRYFDCQRVIALGRSMLECMEILSVAVEKGVRVYAVKGNWSLDSSIQSKIVAMAFSMASEIERDLISQRTKEAFVIKRNKASNSADRPDRANQNSTNIARKSKP